MKITNDTVTERFSGIQQHFLGVMSYGDKLPSFTPEYQTAATVLKHV